MMTVGNGPPPSGFATYARTFGSPFTPGMTEWAGAQAVTAQGYVYNN